MSEEDPRFMRALDAYASATAGDKLDSQALRRRVLEAPRVARRRVSRKLSLVLPIAATFIASAALAASQPAVRQTLRQSVQALFGGTANAPAAKLPGHRRAPPASAPEPLPPVAPAPPGVEPVPISPEDLPAISQPRPPGSSAARAAAPPSTTEPAPAGEPPAPSAEVETYRQAHRRHFGGATPSAALAAWDDYLALYPNGSFAPDARFNRALCLVRLGRRDQARAALAPFAAQPIGSYRQAEAASLLLNFDSAR
jgi:hypothetical protein